MRTIDFTIANPYGIQTQDYDEKQHGYFSGAYEAARKCLKALIKLSIDSQNKSLNKNKKTIWDDLHVSDLYNNIIAFVGDRGSGKSTAMLSFVKRCEMDAEYLGFEHVRIHTLKVIDPSKLAKGEMVLGAVIATLYQDVQEWVKTNHDYTDENIRKIVQSFEKVHEAIRIRYIEIKESLKENPDDLEHLAKLSHNNQLRKSIYDMIQYYLKILDNADEDMDHDEFRDKNSSSILFIPIDDLDTSIEEGYWLAEEIRNFLMIPNVIIPMAIKLDQLSDAVEQQFILMFKEMYHNKDVLDAQPAEMAIKYIQKLIPTQRRIIMPSLTIQTIGAQKLKTAKTQQKEEPVVDYFMQLIYRKTGILLVKDEHDSHPLIPMNLRQLHQCIDFLENLQDIWQEGKSIDSFVLEDNLNELENWLLDSVCSNSVPREMSAIVRQFAHHPNEGINGFLVRAMDQYGIERKIMAQCKGELVYCGLFGNDKAALNIMDVGTNQENISIGDVLYLLSTMKQKDSSEGIRHFVSAILMLYSIRLKRLTSIIAEAKQDIDAAKASAAADRAKIQVGEETIDQAFRQIASVFNGLVYNPVWELTYDGLELILNADATNATFQIGKEAPRLLINSSGLPVNKNAMSLEQMVWISFFAVAYGWVRLKDIHSAKEPVLDTILTPVDGGEPSHVTLNWMAFLNNLLDPTTTIRRMVWQVQPSIKKQIAIEQKKYIEYRNNKLLDTFHIDSVEVLNGMVSVMRRDRFLTRSELEGKEDIAVLRGYFDFLFSMSRSLDKTLAKTALSKNTAMHHEFTIEQRHRSIGQFFNEVYTQEYRQRRTNEITEQRSLDWIANY